MFNLNETHKKSKSVWHTKYNNNHDNVYGAIIMIKVIARVHPVHLMNTDWTPGGRQPSDQANRLGLWVRQRLAATMHIHHRHCYYYSTFKLILISPSHVRCKACVDLGTAVKVCSPCLRLYIAAAVAINATAPDAIQTLVLSLRSQMHWPLGHCDRIMYKISTVKLLKTPPWLSN